MEGINNIALPISILTPSRFSGMFAGAGLSAVGAMSTGSWPAANRAIYVPMFIPFQYPVKRVFWVNGGTTTANADFGIFSRKGTTIYTTGSTAMSGTNATQFTSVDLLLDPGVYYFGLATDGTTGGAIWRSTGFNVSQMKELGVKQQASAFALPTSAATFATLATAYLPLMGITRTASGL